MQAAVLKKQLTDSFVEYFKENHENTICVYFQFYNPKFIQEKCFMLYVCSEGLRNGYSTSEAIDNFFWWAI